VDVFGYRLNAIACVASALLRFLGRPIRFNRRNRLHGVGTENNAFRGKHHEHDHRGDEKVTTLINILTVEPENQQKLIKLLRDNTESVVSRLDGWISTSFIAARDQRHAVIYSQWRDLASVEAMQTNPDMVAYFPRLAALAAFNSLAGDVVYNHHA
jgi:quinol monooxygenase YgiN